MEKCTRDSTPQTIIRGAPREGHVESPGFCQLTLPIMLISFSLDKEAKFANLRLVCRRAASLLGGDHVAKSQQILFSPWVRRLATRQSLDYGIGDIYSEVFEAYSSKVVRCFSVASIASRDSFSRALHDPVLHRRGPDCRGDSEVEPTKEPKERTCVLVPGSPHRGGLCV